MDLRVSTELFQLILKELVGQISGYPSARNVRRALHEYAPASVASSSTMVIS